MKDNTWAEYYKKTQHTKPQKLLLDALKVLSGGKTVLDLGAGSMRDSLYLLEKGYEVTAVDMSTGAEDIASKMEYKNFHFIQTKFEDLDLQEMMYDLVSAQWALSFISSHEELDTLIKDIHSHMNKGGVFVGQIFGVHDEWNTTDTNMTFLTKSEVQNVCKDFEIIELDEEEKDSPTARGQMKHWHIFSIIAQKAD